MQRLLLTLLATFAILACKQQGEAPQSNALEPTQIIHLQLEGSIDYPETSETKSLTLVPGSKGGKNTLVPTFNEGEEVPAILHIRKNTLTSPSNGYLIKLKIGKGGRTYSFFGDIAVPLSKVELGNATHSNWLSLHVGFDFDNGAQLIYPDKAPRYSIAGMRQTISGFNVAFFGANFSHVEQQEITGASTKVIVNRSLNLSLVGHLMRTTITNSSSKAVTVEGIQLNGLGATGMKLGQGGDNTARYRAITEDKDPRSSHRVYPLEGGAITLQPGQTSEPYLVYAPAGVWETAYRQSKVGGLEPIIAQSQAEDFTFDEDTRVLSDRVQSKLIKSRVVIQDYHPIIRPEAIPLQYWNEEVYHEPSFNRGGSIKPQREAQPALSGINNNGQQVTLKDGYYFPNSKTNRPNAIAIESISKVSPQHHVPWEYEFNGVLAPGLTPQGVEEIPAYYQDITTTYDKSSVLDTIRVLDKRLVGKSSFWRASGGAGFTQRVAESFYWTGELGPVYPIYALRYGQLSSSDISSLTAGGYKKRELARDDKSRVAYMYIVRPDGIEVRSCYIGDNAAITKAEDLRTKKVFGDDTSGTWNSSYSNHKIYRRKVAFLGSKLYSPETRDQGKTLNNLRDPKISFSTEALPAYHATTPSAQHEQLPATLGRVPSLPTRYGFRMTNQDDHSIHFRWLNRIGEQKSPGTHKPHRCWLYYDNTSREAGSTFRDFQIRELESGISNRYFTAVIYVFTNTPSTNQGLN